MKSGDLRQITSEMVVYANHEIFSRAVLGYLQDGDCIIFLGETAVAEFLECGSPGQVFESNLVKTKMLRVMTKYGIGWVRSVR